KRKKLKIQECRIQREPSNTKNEPKLWPMRTIPQGGLLSMPPKFEYSKETADLLKYIKASGAYDLSYYRPKPDDKCLQKKAKKLLQEAMSVLQQINERAEWLAEMEELGEGKRYRDEIREQIALRLRQIKAIETKTKLQKRGFRIL
ncbi:hypothetical protein DOY81_010650, partial [Sarcophaga bullata]